MPRSLCAYLPDEDGTVPGSAVLCGKTIAEVRPNCFNGREGYSNRLADVQVCAGCAAHPRFAECKLAIDPPPEVNL